VKSQDARLRAVTDVDSSRMADDPGVHDHKPIYWYGRPGSQPLQRAQITIKLSLVSNTAQPLARFRKKIRQAGRGLTFSRTRLEATAQYVETNDD
jgi:hypothetical protein